MFKLTIPTREELIQLAEYRADACLSVYVASSPLPQHAQAARIDLANLVKEALIQVEARGLDKRRIALLEEELAAVIEADDFWMDQGNSLAVLASPDRIRVYRLPNKLESQVEVSDRFYMKPLFRSHTFSHAAHILALSENEARVVELFDNALPEELYVPDMPKDALTAIGRSSITASSGSLTSESGSRGPKMRLAQYARKVEEALRPIVLANNVPLILFSTEPLAAIYRNLASGNLMPETVFISPDRLSPSELAEMAKPVVAAWHATQLAAVKTLFEERAGQQRVATQLADVAKAATYGMVSLLLVDFNSFVCGHIDEGGTISFAEEGPAYGIIDEVVKRALMSGAEIMAVRAEDMQSESGVAAILRYSL